MTADKESITPRTIHVAAAVDKCGQEETKNKE